MGLQCHWQAKYQAEAAPIIVGQPCLPGTVLKKEATHHHRLAMSALGAARRGNGAVLFFLKGRWNCKDQCSLLAMRSGQVRGKASRVQWGKSIVFDYSCLPRARKRRERWHRS